MNQPWWITILLLSSAGCAKCAPQVSFRRDVLPELVRSCATAEGCHGDAPTDSVSLDLREPVAFLQLVRVPSEARPGTTRVTPGSPQTSFILDKLRGTLRNGEGKSMPLDPDTGAPIEPSPLPPGYVDNVLAKWIAEGAVHN